MIFEDTTEDKVQDYLSFIEMLLGDSLKIEWKISTTSVDFLDINITRHMSTEADSLELRVHQKALNNYMYLPIQSAHHKNVHKAWMRAELVRYVTHSSCVQYYNVMVERFQNRLALRGISYDFTNPVVASVKYNDRNNYLYPAPSSKKPHPLALVIPYDSSTCHLKVSAFMRTEIEKLVLEDRSMRSLFYTRDGELLYLTSWTKGRNLGSLLCS